MNEHVFHITGPPGTGKTKYVTDQAKRFIEEVGADRLLVASLTKAAAVEFSGRGLSVIPEAQLGTLHHICLAALGKPELTNKHLAEWRAYAKAHNQPGYALTSEELRQSGMDTTKDDQSEGDQLYQELQVLRNVNPGIMQSDRPTVRDRVLWFYMLWTQWKEEMGYMDFTDLLEQCIEHVPKAPGHPDVLFGDEAQDWSKLEAQLFRDQWGKDAYRVCLVGDPDQSIYVWRGADPRIFMDFKIPDENKILLERSYRVPGDIRDCALAWIEFGIQDRDKVVYEPRPEQGCVQLTRATFNSPQPLKPILEEVLAGDETCMILASCSYMLIKTLQLMRKCGIPFSNPHRTNQGAWNPLRRGGYKRKGTEVVTKLDRLLAFLAPSWNTFGKRSHEWTWGEIHKWIEPLRIANTPAKGSKPAKKGVCVRNARKQALEYAEETKKPGAFVDDNYRRFGELFVGGWDGPHAQLANRMDLDWWIDSMLEKEAKGYGYLRCILKQRGVQALIDPPRIHPGTIHSVKGGQADTVILFPDLSPSGAKLYWSDDGAQVVRLFYVGMTRAYKRLIICEPANGKHVNLMKASGVRAEVI